MARRVDLVENAEAIVWSEAQLPVRPEGNRPFQRFPISGFHVGFVKQLGHYLGLDHRMVLRLDGPQVQLHLVGIHQCEWLSLRHDDYNYGRVPGACQYRAEGATIA